MYIAARTRLDRVASSRHAAADRRPKGVVRVEPKTHMQSPIPLIVPGLRDHAPQHWQTLLARTLPNARSLTPLGRDNLALAPRIAELEATIAGLSDPVLLVAHSGGCVLVAHWARQTAQAHRVAAALLATPPTFDRPLPPGYPRLEDLDAAGWLPVPRMRLPFPSLVAASRDDPLGEFDAVGGLAQAWGSQIEDLGAVGHLNPASGFGPWPGAEALMKRLVSQESVERGDCRQKSN